MHVSPTRQPYETVLVDAVSGEPDLVAPRALQRTITIRLRLDQPGLPQLLRVGERYRSARELHLLCPGHIDSIVLGSTMVTLGALREDREMRAAFMTFGRLLGVDASFVLGGANVGQGLDGQAFLQTLADLVQREVCALVRIPPRARISAHGSSTPVVDLDGGDNDDPS
jgi:Domain of unknown function (DUF4347)